ncbi:hypothetical protein [Nitratireductor sp.]|uniref:hypothetical protein n=1 Tax=Nitratireductor sp. TaxID=1872084 RepID=UPI00261F6B0F|nr:hypothetical protein [Nitratireductor sp.]MCV0380088.1 hypothetical protein [Nitratireductor sp.]
MHRFFAKGDLDLNFCKAGIWEDVVKSSQGDLFDIDFLLGAGADFREQYSGAKPVSWPNIPADVAKFEQGKADDICAGYDMPITFTPDNWNGRFFALIAQDPLRKPLEGKGKRQFTLATPWGFSNPEAPKAAHNGKLWPSVEAICRSGHGVYLTDASKIYIHPKNSLKTAETRALEDKVFKKEMEAVKPVHVVVFGREAEASICALGVSSYDYHPHISAWGKQKSHYGTENETHAVIAGALMAQIARNSGVELS